MKTLTQHMHEALKVSSKSQVNKGQPSTTVEFINEDGKINAEDLYAALYDAWWDSDKSDDMMVYADDPEDGDEKVYFEYDGIYNSRSLEFNYCSRMTYVEMDALVNILKDLEDFIRSHKYIWVNTDGMVDEKHEIVITPIISKHNNYVSLYIK